MASSSPSPRILPYLQELQCGTDPFILQLFGHPSVDVHIVMRGFYAGRDPEVLKSFMTSLPTYMPTFYRFTFEPSVNYSPSLESTLAISLPTFRSLTSLDLAEEYFSPRITKVLSTISGLERLWSTHSWETMRDDMFSNELDTDSFPSLIDLSLFIPFGRAVKCFSRGFALNVLEDLRMTTYRDETLDDFAKMLRIIARNWSTSLSLLHIICEGNPASSPITFPTLQPLLSCSHLRHLLFVYPVPLQITQDQLVELVKALPSLTRLTLPPHTTYDSTPPTLTMSALPAIAPLCNQLQYLSIYLSFDGPPCPMDADLPAAPFKRLEELCVGRSPVSNPASVARTLCRVLPEDCSIWGFQPGITPDNWGPVRSMLSALRTAPLNRKGLLSTDPTVDSCLR